MSLDFEHQAWLGEQAKPKRPYYVLATDIVLNHLDAIPFPWQDSDKSQDGASPKQPQDKTGLRKARVIIPTAVVRELSELHKNTTDHVPKRALTYLRRLAESRLTSMDAHYELHMLEDQEGEANFAILPVHQNFAEAIPFKPAADDYGGQTILAALTVMFILAGLRIDGTALKGMANGLQPDASVVLLTNDDCLAIRARVRGVATAKLVD